VAVEGTGGVDGRPKPPMQVVAFSTPRDPLWRWRIVNYAGETIEESRETFPTIAGAVEVGSRRLRRMDIVDTSTPSHPGRSTRHLRIR
jgi:hypothetical protein